jgi:hypothetical protein
VLTKRWWRMHAALVALLVCGTARGDYLYSFFTADRTMPMQFSSVGPLTGGALAAAVVPVTMDSPNGPLQVINPVWLTFPGPRAGWFPGLPTPLSVPFYPPDTDPTQQFFSVGVSAISAGTKVFSLDFRFQENMTVQFLDAPNAPHFRR